MVSRARLSTRSHNRPGDHLANLDVLASTAQLDCDLVRLTAFPGSIRIASGLAG
jgi:hypothetical protein